MDRGVVEDKFAKGVAALGNFADPLIEFIEKPSVKVEELVNINDSVMEFFRLVNEANTVDLNAEDTLQLYRVVATFHKAVTKKYQKLNGKVLMAEPGDTTVKENGKKMTGASIADLQRKAETGWEHLLKSIQRGGLSDNGLSDKSDIRLREIFNENGIGYVEGDDFIDADTERNLKREVGYKGYKLHINVSLENVMNFLEDAVPILGKEGTAFKIWKPSLLGEQEGSQQGKLVTIYAQSRSEAIRVISTLNPILAKYAPGQMPPYEKQLTAFISYRYADFSDEVLNNPWNPNDTVSGGEGRLGIKVASWARGIEEKPRLVSRSDIDEGRAKTGDVVALLGVDGKYVPAELVGYRPIAANPELAAQGVYLRPLAGRDTGKILDKTNLQNISRTPGEKSDALFVLEKILNTGSKMATRFDVANGNTKQGDIIAIDTTEGYVPAEIVTGSQSGSNAVSVVVLAGVDKGKRIDMELKYISRTPSEKLGYAQNLLLGS